MRSGAAKPITDWLQARLRREHTGARSLLLLVSLICLLGLSPWIGTDPEGNTSFIGRSLWSVVPLTGVYALSQRRRTIILAIALATPALLYAWFPVKSYVTLGPTLGLSAILFYLLTTLVTLGHVFRSETLSHDRMYAALSAYFLFGMTFGLAYFFIEINWPGSLQYNRAPDAEFTMYSSLYFSFSTLTTLGFGDITPGTQRVQALVIMEATLGVLYVAVLVARLVSAVPHRGVAAQSPGKELQRTEGQER